MDGELAGRCYARVRAVARRLPRRRGVTHSDARVLEVLLWAVVHDRPVSWACRRSSWPTHRRAAAIPSPATMSRRLRTASVVLLLQWTLAAWTPQPGRAWVYQLDALPLPVGGASKDRGTRHGRGAGGVGKGYKLFVLTAAGLPVAWRVGPMNLAEHVAAEGLLREAARCGHRGYVVADSAYDANRLYRLASSRGFVLVAHRKRPGRGLGHAPQDPARLHAIELTEGGSAFGRALMKRRLDVERAFAWWGCFPGGLGPLPRFVRTPRRVALWVATKLLIAAIHHHDRRQKAA